MEILPVLGDIASHLGPAPTSVFDHTRSCISHTLVTALPRSKAAKRPLSLALVTAGCLTFSYSDSKKTQQQNSYLRHQKVVCYFLK